VYVYVVVQKFTSSGEYLLIISSSLSRHNHEHKRNLLDVSIRFDEGVYAKQLCEWRLDDFEGGISVPVFCFFEEA
jgi:hypothetical protein